jgi:polysaccharide export outer membrane protein
MKFDPSSFRISWTALGLSLCVATGCATKQLAAQTPVQTPAQIGTPAAAQTPTPTDSPAGTSANPQQSTDPVLSIRNQKVLESFEPAANEEYTLGAGDEISLDFPGHSELSGKKTVGPDGMITLTLAGPVHIVNMTRDAAGKAITDALSKYYNDLSVTVSIDKYSSNRVRVLGYVQHPGAILFEDTPTLLDAIGKAGMITPTVTSGGVSSNVGSGIPETVTIYRGNDTAVQVQLRQLLMSGSTLSDMRLRRNDIVYVPEPKESFVSVLGQVSKPGTIALTPASTLTSILAEAGCCSDNGGFNPTIHILQPSTGKDFKVSYKQIMTLPGQQEYTLHSGDVIVVPMSGMSKFTTVVQKISPIATMVSLAAIV